MLTPLIQRSIIVFSPGKSIRVNNRSTYLYSADSTNYILHIDLAVRSTRLWNIRTFMKEDLLQDCCNTLCSFTNVIHIALFSPEVLSKTNHFTWISLVSRHFFVAFF